MSSETIMTMKKVIAFMKTATSILESVVNFQEDKKRLSEENTLLLNQANPPEENIV